MPILYKGFSTVDRVKKFRLNDFDLVKQDIINHFKIKKGEKLMQPNFGSIIWSLMFEQMTDATHQAIIDDVKSIVGYDPRTRLTNVTINEYQNGIQIGIDLVFVPTNQQSTLALQFDNQTKTLTTNQFS